MLAQGFALLAAKRLLAARTHPTTTTPSLLDSRAACSYEWLATPTLTLTLTLTLALALALALTCSYEWLE